MTTSFLFLFFDLVVSDKLTFRSVRLCSFNKVLTHRLITVVRNSKCFLFTQKIVRKKRDTLYTVLNLTKNCSHKQIRSELGRKINQRSVFVRDTTCFVYEWNLPYVGCKFVQGGSQSKKSYVWQMLVSFVINWRVLELQSLVILRFIYRIKKMFCSISPIQKCLILYIRKY